MKITKLEKQKKAKNRYNIYIDGEFFCGLYDDTILKFGIHINEEVTEKEIEEIKGFDEIIYGKNVAYNYLSYRIRSVFELKKKLKEKKISESATEKVLELLEKQKLINDAEFARVLISDKIKRKPVGKKVLRGKLFEKGISKQVGEDALDEVFTEDVEKELALASFMKYLPKLKGKESFERKRKAFDYLARKGFEFDVINEILKENIQ